MAITDAKAIFGKSKNKSLNAAASICAMEELHLQHKEELGLEVDKAAALAYGFLHVTNMAVCQLIRALTWYCGHKLLVHVLICFGRARL